MVEKHNNNKEVSSSVQIICKKLEIDLQKENDSFLKQNKKRQKDIIETKEEVGKVKDMLKPKDNSTFKESLCRKLEVEEEIGKDELKERRIVNKGRKNKNNNLTEKIDQRLKLIEKSIVDTQNNSSTELN